jgi:hypothetical protein
VICFITGVPGAGKTLAGMNVVNSVHGGSATFLSGNGPLVSILREALALDHSSRKGVRIGEARHRSGTFVTNVHRWLDEYIDRSPDRVPLEQVVVFDEAQRAWSREHSKRKFKRDESEPAMVLQVMNRHSDWAVVVALVGGGQEINTGEAGLAEWGRALDLSFNNWKVAISPELLEGSPSTSGTKLFEQLPKNFERRLTIDAGLHLSVSIRTFRTTQLNSWVEAVLGGNTDEASNIARRMPNYPLRVTRDLEACREWLRSKARGLRRAGLVASSGARRLRPLGLNVSERFDEADWFLKGKSDIRSSDYLELAATEFAIQGLEIDWSGLCWGGDLRRTEHGWQFLQFRGTAWIRVTAEDDRRFILNRYRVLMTRAREGLIIWVPLGDSRDPTRAPSVYDPTYEYLRKCGMKPIGCD